VVLLVSGVSAFAISNGEPDNGAHPYVALIYDFQGGWVCSGSAISPTVLITAAHCFDYENVLVTFSETPPYAWVTGTWYPDPDWCIGCGGGLPGFDTHDIAVVVLDSPITLSRYASLPSEGLVDTLSHKSAIDLVGYGVQFDQGGGPRIPYDGAYTRYKAMAELFNANFVHSDEFIRLSANPSQGKGGTCFGDSGGPDLIAGTDIILAVNSYVTNGNCAGVTYSNRIDTPDALEFIGQFIE
jgi:hypothetical protein